jgi:hypothetical protein
VIYVVDRNNMGHHNATTDPVVQEWTADGRSFSTPAFWDNTLYYFGVQFGTGHPGESFAFDPGSGMFTTTPSASTPSTFRFSGATPSVSASSPTDNGIVWAIETGSHGTDGQPAMPPAAPYPPAGPAVLHAFDANNIGTELWNSSTNASDAAGNAVKFTVPTIANGKVYVPTRGNDDTLGGGTVFGQVDVYGLRKRGPALKRGYQVTVIEPQEELQAGDEVFIADCCRKRTLPSGSSNHPLGIEGWGHGECFYRHLHLKRRLRRRRARTPSIN